MLAYIDAASGGMIVAALAGGVAGVRVAVKSILPGRRRRRSADDGTEPGTAERRTPQAEATSTDSV